MVRAVPQVWYGRTRADALEYQQSLVLSTHDTDCTVHVGNHVNSFTKGYIQQINTKYLIYVGTG